jgi:predicted anti-sigma-YlaC factor YlaD
MAQLMTTHLSETQINDFVDATLPDADRGSVEAHIRSCAECRERVAAVARLLSRLQEMPRESEPAGWVRERLIADSRRPVVPRQRRTPSAAILRSLAAAVLMTVSFLGGRWSMAPDASSVRPAETSTDAALAVQQSGTAYVQALAVLVSARDTTTPDVIAQGREAGIAALYAAAAEFSRLLPADADARRMLEAAEATHRRAVGSGLNDQVRF